MARHFRTKVYCAFTALGTLSTTLSGCFFSESPLSNPPAVNVSYELYMARASLTGTEYEQYKLLPMGLYHECGLIRRGRSVVTQQGILTLPQSARSEMATLISGLSERVLSNPPDHMPAPGNNADMFDPGKYLLTGFVDGKPLSIKTSFDAVVNGGSEMEQVMARLAETARGVSETPPCKNIEFFGLQRRAPKDPE
jgi:hypothetical protein